MRKWKKNMISFFCSFFYICDVVQLFVVAPVVPLENYAQVGFFIGVVINCRVKSLSCLYFGVYQKLANNPGVLLLHNGMRMR